MLDWIGLRRRSAEHSPSLRGTKVPGSGCRARRNIPQVPTYKRAASECDYACFGAQRTPPSGPARSVTIGAANSSAGEGEVGQWAWMQLHDAKKRLQAASCSIVSEKAAGAVGS